MKPFDKILIALALYLIATSFQGGGLLPSTEFDGFHCVIVRDPTMLLSPSQASAINSQILEDEATGDNGIFLLLDTTDAYPQIYEAVLPPIYKNAKESPQWFLSCSKTGISFDGDFPENLEIAIAKVREVRGAR